MTTERPPHVRALTTGALFCDRCHSAFTFDELGEHRHLPQRPDGVMPLPFDQG